MHVTRHWLAYWDAPTGGPAVSPVLVWDEKSANEYDEANYRVEGPFVPEPPEGAVDRITELEGTLTLWLNCAPPDARAIVLGPNGKSLGEITRERLGGQ